MEPGAFVKSLWRKNNYLPLFQSDWIYKRGRLILVTVSVLTAHECVCVYVHSTVKAVECFAGSQLEPNTASQSTCVSCGLLDWQTEAGETNNKNTFTQWLIWLRLSLKAHDIYTQSEAKSIKTYWLQASHTDYWNAMRSGRWLQMRRWFFIFLSE